MTKRKEKPLTAMERAARSSERRLPLTRALAPTGHLLVMLEVHPSLHTPNGAGFVTLRMGEEEVSFIQETLHVLAPGYNEMLRREPRSQFIYSVVIPWLEKRTQAYFLPNWKWWQSSGHLMGVNQRWCPILPSSDRAVTDWVRDNGGMRMTLSNVTAAVHLSSPAPEGSPEGMLTLQARQGRRVHGNQYQTTPMPMSHLFNL
jgi:hypothetical protein